MDIYNDQSGVYYVGVFYGNSGDLYFGKFIRISDEQIRVLEGFINIVAGVFFLMLLMGCVSLGLQLAGEPIYWEGFNFFGACLLAATAFFSIFGLALPAIYYSRRNGVAIDGRRLIFNWRVSFKSWLTLLLTMMVFVLGLVSMPALRAVGGSWILLPISCLALWFLFRAARGVVAGCRSRFQ